MQLLILDLLLQLVRCLFYQRIFCRGSNSKIILDQYSNRPSYKLGLQINESLITSDDDSSLFDNALGSSNFASPGADRLQIIPKLVKQNLTFLIVQILLSYLD